MEFDNQDPREAVPVGPVSPLNRGAVQPVQTAAVVARQSAEVQAAVFMAKQFPRDVDAAIVRINKACSRKGLAEEAEYAYPRGGERVTGPSIRLAEVIAQNWGNMDFGIVQLEQRPTETVMQAYAWDLETNTRQTRLFHVPHIRETKAGKKSLDDSRDVYELTANMGARRLRACILGVIPGDIVDMAVDTCRKTMKGAYTEPLEDRVRKMLVAFEKDYNVPKDAIEKYVGFPSVRFDENDLAKLRKVYAAIKDGVGKREDYFDLGAPPAAATGKTKTEAAFHKDTPAASAQETDEQELDRKIASGELFGEGGK